MKKHNTIIMILVITGCVLMIIGMMLGVQFLLGFMLNFSFTHSFGSLFMCLAVLIAFILLVPVSMFLDAIILHIGSNRIIGLILSEAIQFILFSLLMHKSVIALDLVKFNSTNTEWVYYLIMYLFFFLLGSAGEIIKREDEKSISKKG